MISHEVGAIWKIVDQGSATIKAFSDGLFRLDKIALGVQQRLEKIGGFKFGGNTEALAQLGRSLDSVTLKGDATQLKLKEISETRFAGLNRGLTGVDERLERIERRARGAGSALLALPSPRGGGGGGATPASHGGGSSGRPHGREGAGVDAGFFGFMGVTAVGEGMAKLIEAGGKLEHFQSQIEAATGSALKMQEATSAAWDETSRNLNTTVSDNLKNIKELQQVTGSMDEARLMLHPFTLANTALQSLKDNDLKGALAGGVGQQNNTYNFARSLEQLGVTQDEDKLNSYTASLTRMMIGMQGTMDGTKLYNAINNAGGARYGWDQDFATFGLGPLIQATNGRAGAQLYQLSRSLGQGVSTEQMAKGAEKYGLWNESDEIYEAGKFKGMKVGSVYEADILKHNPVKWAGDVREMMRGRGVNVDDTDTMTGVVAEASRGNKNLGAIMDELLLPKSYAALMKERSNIQNVPEDAVTSLQKNDPSIAMSNFTKQWENLLTALGAPSVTKATDTLNMMSSGMNAMARWADDHPMAGKVLVEGMTAVGIALGALTAVGVTAALAMFLPGGTMALGVSAMLGVFGSFVVFHGKDALVASLNFMHSIPDTLVSIFTSIQKRLQSIPGIGHLFDPAAPNEARTKDDRIGGLKPHWYDGFGALGGLGFTPMSYGAANDNGGPLADAVYSGFMRAFRELSGGGAGGMNAGAAGSGGFTNAAFTTFGSGGPSGGAGLSGLMGKSAGNFLPGAPGGAVDAALKLQGLGSGGAAAALGAHMTNGEWCADFVNGALATHGIKGSGSSAALSFSHWGRGVGMSDAQKGDVAFENHGGGHGHAMLLTGEHDPRGWLGVVAGNSGGRVKHYWENPNKIAGIRRAVPTVEAPRPKVAPGAPASGGFQANAAAPIHVALHLDGKVIARHTVKQVTAGLRFPTSMGGPDTHGTYVSPGTPLTDAA